VHVRRRMALAGTSAEGPRLAHAGERRRKGRENGGEEHSSARAHERA
jgi:hypothetical protein